MRFGETNFFHHFNPSNRKPNYSNEEVRGVLEGKGKGKIKRSLKRIFESDSLCRQLK